MEPTHKLIIAMLVAYIPFIWYWVSLAIKEMKETEAEKRRRLRRKRKDLIEHWNWKE